MVRYLHDGTPEGILTACYHAIQDNVPTEIVACDDNVQPSLFASDIRVDTDLKLAEMLWQNVLSVAGPQVIQYVIYAMMNANTEIHSNLPVFIQLSLTHGNNVLQFHTEPVVKAVLQGVRQVTGEIHRFNGLTRFRELPDGMLYAPLEPDHCILLPLAKHFMQRLRDESWCLHDVRRGYGILWKDGKMHCLSNVELPSDPGVTETEEEISGLWQSYYHHIAIPERKNDNLRRSFMPRRYWKYLTEIKSARAIV